MRRIVSILLVLVLTLAAAGYLWARRPAGAVESSVVRRGAIESSVTAFGTLQPRRYVDVGAQVSGQILRLHVQPGDVVNKGQLLVEIDPSVQRATVDAGRASLAGLRAQLAGQQHARQRRMAADETGNPPGEDRANHEELAMRNIDHAHHTKDQGQSERHQ